MNNRYMRKLLTVLLCTALFVTNTLSTGIQASATEIATDTLVTNGNPSEEGIDDAVDVAKEGNVVDNVADDLEKEDYTEEDADTNIDSQDEADSNNGNDKDDIENRIENSEENFGDEDAKDHSAFAVANEGELKSGDQFSDDFFIYEVLDEVSVKICSNYNEVTSIEIPRTVTYGDKNYLITTIGARAFESHNIMTNVIIHYGVHYIEERAFSNCKSLINIEIANSVNQIHYGAFSGCSSLTSIEIPDSVNYIDGMAFSNCSSLTSINIPGNFRNIYTGTFSGCESLININIPNSVTNIGVAAFNNCSSLESIEIPDSVTVISEIAFSGCSSLISINIPEGVTRINHSTFSGCSSLTEIDIPDSVTSIGSNAFSDCINLAEVDIPNSVTSIDEYAFSGCSSLTKVAIPDGVTTVSKGILSGCNGLEEVIIPDGVTEIMMYAFENCNSLSSVYIPKGVQTLGSCAFDCDLKSIRFKGDVSTYFEYDMFGRVGREITVYYPISNATWTKEIKQKFLQYANITWIPWNPKTGEVFAPDGSNSDATFFFGFALNYYVYEEDMTIWLSGDFKAMQNGNVSEEADAIVWESSDPLIADINHVRYIPDIGNIYGDNNADTLAYFDLYLDCYKPGTVTITGTSADGRTINETITVEPKLIAGESTHITNSSDVMLCKVELTEKTDERLAYLQNFFEGLEINIVDPLDMKMDLKLIIQSGVDYLGLYIPVDTDSFGVRTTFEITSLGGQAVQVDVFNDSVITNTVVYYRDGNRDSTTFNYSLDSCLEKDATEYNPDLAHMLIALANSAYHKEDLDFTLLEDADSGTFPDNPLVITESLRNLGFAAENGDVREFNYYSSSSDDNYGKDTTAFILATKEMSDGTTLISIVVRGSYGELDIFDLTSDWESNRNFKNQGVGLHEGFDAAANEIIQELNKFKNDKSIKGNKVKYVITGHSRGAAVSNLVAKKLIDNGVSTNNVYDYNFACPDSGRDYSSKWNPNGKYDSLYNINNVRDIVGVIPGNIFNSSLNINTFLFSDEFGIVFWGKYGRTYFFAERWDTVKETMIGLPDQHSATLYLDNMRKKQSIGSFKSWEQARATLAANALEDAMETFLQSGWIFGVFCPVDIEIIDKDGVKIAEVVNGQAKYYTESFGDVVIITAGDQSLVYVNGRNDYFVKFTGYDTGEMTYCVSDAVLGSEYGKEIKYTNVSLSQGKTMVSILNDYEQSDKVTLVLFDEELNPVKQIDCNGTEQELSDELKEEYSNLPLDNEARPGNPSSQQKGIHIVGLEASYEYTGAKIIPNIGVMDYDVDGGKLLASGVDYTVKYKNNINVGTAEITVTGKGNYTGKDINEKFSINAVDNAQAALENLKGAKITDLETKLTYDGEAKYPKFMLSLNGGTPKQYEYNKERGVYETTDGEKDAIPANVSLSNNINKGTATILLKGANDTKIKKTFKITAIDLAANASKVKVEVNSATYAVKGAAPTSITVTYDGKKLKNGTDYTVKYSSNKKVTTAAKVVVTGKGNYAKKYSSSTFAIEKLDLSNVEVRAVTAYAGLKASKVKATVVDGQGNALKPSQYTLYVYKDKDGTSLFDASEVLAEKSKIYVEAKAKDTVNLDGVTPRGEFDVGTNITKAKVTDNNGKTITKLYTGSPIMFTAESANELKVTLNGTNLTMGTDYEIVSYSNNTNKGTATAVLKGIGSYSGTKTFKFKISAKKMQIGGKTGWDDILNLIKGFMSH